MKEFLFPGRNLSTNEKWRGAYIMYSFLVYRASMSLHLNTPGIDLWYNRRETEVKYHRSWQSVKSKIHLYVWQVLHLLVRNAWLTTITLWPVMLSMWPSSLGQRHRNYQTYLSHKLKKMIAAFPHTAQMVSGFLGFISSSFL